MKEKFYCSKCILYSSTKSLDGKYVLESKVLGLPVTNSGNWSLVLYDYSQTTTVTRLGKQGKLTRQ